MNCEVAYRQGKIDAVYEIEQKMYCYAFEVDHSEDGMQRWDSGNWIRYRLFTDVMNEYLEEVKKCPRHLRNTA